MKIRHSTEQDFERIMEIYAYARRFMAEHGNPNQWGPTCWPPEDLIHGDIRSGDSYVCTDDEGHVVGTFYYICGEEAYLKHVTRQDESLLKITFEKGEIVAVNDEHYSDKVAAIQKIEEIGAAYGIGRDCNVGDTIIGIKGRVGFEAAAPKLIIEAHRLLEKSTLSKWQQYWKDQVAQWYGMFLHESQYLEPVMPDIEAMLTSSQRHVNGTAILKLRPLGFETVGVDSQDDLLKSKLGEYGEMQHGWTSEEAKGFIKVLSTPLRVYYGIHKDEKR